MIDSFSLNDFEELITNLSRELIHLDGFDLHKINQPLELSGAAGGYLRREEAICPTKFMFLLSEKEISTCNEENILEYSQEICWNKLFNSYKSIFGGISDSFGPMSFSQSFGLIDLGGDYMYLLNSPDDMAPRFCSYFKREDYPKKMKTLIESIFFTQGELLDKEYPIFRNGLWGTNEVSNFFDKEFCRHLIKGYLDRTNFWAEEKEILINEVTLKNSSTKDYIRFQLENLESFTKKVLDQEPESVIENLKDELSEKEKLFLVEAILENRFKFVD